MGNFITAEQEQSSSVTNEKTGNIVYIVEYPKIKYPLYIGMATK
jgi:hypothetical protein